MSEGQITTALVALGGVVGYVLGYFIMAPPIPGSFTRICGMMAWTLVGAGIGLGISTRLFRKK